MRIYIGYDQDSECPNEFDGWEVRSFSNRHVNFTHPDSFDMDEVEAGRAFLLSYYEHGNCIWKLNEDSPFTCPWDSVGVAGIVRWNGTDTLEQNFDTPEQIKDSARSFVEVYTKWCNGEVYYYDIINDEGVTVEACGGFIGTDYIREEIDAAVKYLQTEGDPLAPSGEGIIITGDAAWIMD